MALRGKIGLDEAEDEDLNYFKARTRTKYEPIFAATRRDGASFPNLFVARRQETPDIHRSSLLDLGETASRHKPREVSVMNSNWQQIESRISRRGVLKSLAGTAALHVLRSSAQERTDPALIPNSPNPRWYGFNLLEYFSTDPDWMKMFPYKNDGEFREDDFRWMRDWGFNFVRLPLDYRFWTNSTDPLKIDEKKVERIDRAIRLGEKYGIHVNICMHRAPGECVLDLSDPSVTGIRITKENTSVYTDPNALNAFSHQWSYFASRYKSISNAQLSFNLLNEPARISSSVSFSSINPAELAKSLSAGKEDYARVATAAIEAIRQQDPKRLIVSDGYPFAQDIIPQLFASKVIQSCHEYDPAQLTLYRAPWSPHSDGPLPTWPLKDQNGVVIADRSTMQKTLQKWATLSEHGIPIHFGELGCYSQTPSSVVYAWFDDALDLISELHSGWALWNLRGSFGILDSDRKCTNYQDWHGHRLDAELLALLRRH